MFEFFFWGIVGILFYLIFRNFIPKNIRSIFIEFGANRSFRTTYKKLKQIIDEEYDKPVTKFLDEDSKSTILNNLYTARKEADETKDKYIQLSEKFKHDIKKKYEAILDWSDYTKYFEEWVSGFDATSKWGVDPDFDHINEINLRSQEIIKRFNRLLVSKES